MRHALAAALLVFAAALPSEAVRPSARAKEEAKRFGLNRLEPRTIRAPRAGVQNEFSRFNSSHEGRWKMRIDARTGAPEALSEGRTAPRSGPPAAIARQFLQEQAGMLGVDPNALQIEKESAGDGLRHVLYRQTYRGLPVEFARVKVHLDDHGSVIGANSTYEPDLNLSLTPAISAADAVRAAETDSRGAADGAAVLVVLPVESTGRSHLAWKVKIKAPQAAWRYYVDALTGQILFRYNNLRFAVCLTSGVIQGSVFDIDPSSTPARNRPIDNQWVYIADASTRALTGGDPVYGHGFFCGGATGKVSMGYQGPYVNVANFRGPSAHYDNGGGVWQTLATPVSSPHPYPNSAIQISTINLTLAAPLAVKFLPVFSTFKVGAFSGADTSDTAGGGIADDDQLSISDGNGDPVASFIGNRGGFNGAAVAGRIMKLTLKSNESGQQDGYDVSLSSYLTLTSPFTYGAPNTSSHVWTTADAPINLRGELNLFYHLNQMHDYFFGDVNRSSAAPVSRPVVAMAHVGPNMANAFYNPDYDNLMFGDVNTNAPEDGFTDDATVSHHEYVHYLVEKIWSIQNFGQAGALSEGFSDYFAASSLNDPAIGASVVGSLGGTGSLRDLDCQLPGVTCKVLSSLSWLGEIHDDSIYFSQALWDIRRDRIANLPTYALGRSCADGLVFQSLLFFPESFGEFYDAMRRVDATGAVSACGGAGTAQAAINTAFASHGLILGAGDALERNDGFETATDVSTRSAISATIFPSADTDFYSFAAGPGLVKITLNLPASGGYYKGYQIKLFDRSRRQVAAAAPPFNGLNTVDGSCETFDCNTSAATVQLVYNNPTGGQLYAQIAGGDSLNGSASGVQSAAPYSLVFEYPKGSALSGSIVSATFDNDTISFNVDVSSFVSTQDWSFASAQLRDHAFNPLANTQVTPQLPPSAPAAGTYLIFLSSGNAYGHITGSVKLAPGFAARYPASGTVYLEVFGYNVHSGTSTTSSSLGLSNPLNLTATMAELTAYNNVFNPARGEKATVKYATLTAGRVAIKLYTVTGTYIATLLDADMPPGRGNVDWDGRNVSGSVVASGIYLLRIDAPGIHKTQKIAIIK
ncbi:MAG: PepSY domain-containing protein [Elusimicrobia bacterium]|nr:PepSY domain-containing protein [Elusimicrobiota bacterium]